MKNVFKKVLSLKGKGQILVEVILALTIGVFVLAALAAISATLLSTQLLVTTTNNATHYADDGMEYLRNLRITNYSTFFRYSGNYCLDNNYTYPFSSGTCSGPSGPNNFVRYINFSKNVAQCGLNMNTMKVTVYVEWSDAKCSSSSSYCHILELDSCFSNINAVPTLP